MKRVGILLICAVACAPPPFESGAQQAVIGATAPGSLARVDRPVLDLMRAWRRGGDFELEAVARQRGSAVRGDQLLVQLQLRAGRALDEAVLASLGARVRSRGTTVVDAWAPVGAIAELARLDGVADVGLPRRPAQSLGAIETQGVALTGLADTFCTGVTGAGVQVANIDLSFAGIDQAVADGEIGTLDSMPSLAGNPHGTATSEIIFDMAPGIVLHPVVISTFADLQAFAGTLDGSIGVVSQSLTWTGFSFGDDSGPMCDFVDQVDQSGAVFVTSAGNEGHGRFYAGTWTDADGDQIHEPVAGDEINELEVTWNGYLYVFLDWDAYPTTDVDYDLRLQRWDGSGWVPAYSSTRVQDGSRAPFEEIVITDITPGRYGVVIDAPAPPALALPVRIFVLGGFDPQLEHWQADGSLVDPASCANALTVGAARYDEWGDGVIYFQSSQGPTSDGRSKPDLVAPTGVATSVWPTFFGTSASAPHVAGAIALLMEGGGVDAVTAAQLLLADAVGEGTVPNSVFGYGRLAVDPTRSGWACTPDVTITCRTPCASNGTRTCDITCSWDVCELPSEVCNGLDDDCDGALDNIFACVLATTEACMTSCGTVGSRVCDESCEWGACNLPDEVCNGKDDDCDGRPDNGFSCVLGSRRPCATACGSIGQRECVIGCYLGACSLPAEVCNGVDDDCDGEVDEDFECRPGSESACKAACGTIGSFTCGDDCRWQLCDPPREVRNGADDDCDGDIDEGTCGCRSQERAAIWWMVLFTVVGARARGRRARAEDRRPMPPSPPTRPPDRS